MSSRKSDGCAASSSIYERFDPRHYELYRRTWQRYVADGEAIPITEPQLRALYEANPAGASVVAVAERGSEWIGAISAIAASFALPNGSNVNAYQIGDFMVDPNHQGKGLGGELLAELTRFLGALAAPVYTFPNSRSVGIFLKQSYIELRSLPLVAYPLPSAVIAAKLGSGAGARTRELTIEGACEVADELVSRPRRFGALAKSGDYLRWRYARMRSSDAYCFAAVEQAGGKGRALVASRQFRYRGVPVQVVVDVLDDGDSPLPLGAVASIGLRRGGIAGVSNVEPSRARGLPPLSVRIPRRFDPRPACLLVPPNQPAAAALFSDCRFATGDWMGF